MKIRIENLRLRAIIGCNDWERDKKQEVVVNAVIETSDERACRTDDINDTLDYRELTKRVIASVEGSEHKLLERLTAEIIDLIMQDKRVSSATVRVDKPHALRFADSVSIELTARR